MLSAKNRLHNRQDIEKVFRQGRGTHGQFLSVKFLPNNLNHSRFAIIVSKKVSSNAVERNRIKRQVREILRLNLKEIKTGLDIVLICYPTILGKKQNEIKEKLLDVLSKI